MTRTKIWRVILRETSSLWDYHLTEVEQQVIANNVADAARKGKRLAIRDYENKDWFVTRVEMIAEVTG